MTPSAPPPHPQQPYPYGPPQMQPPRPPSASPSADPGALFRLIAGLFGALAAILVLVGSFLPQTTFEQIVSGKTESSQTISAWSRSFDIEPSPDAQKFYESTHVAHYGIPLSVGAVVLLAGAVLALLGVRRSASPGTRTGARTALLVGGAGVAAAVWMLGMDVSATLSYESDDDSIKSHYTTGTGFWLLLGGGALAVVVLAFALLAGRRATAPAGPPANLHGGPGYPQQQSRPYPVGPQQSGGYPGSSPYPGQQPYGGPQQQTYPGQGPQSQPFPAQGPPSQPFATQGPPSQPFPAQPFPSSQPFPAQPFPSQQPADGYEATQAQPHPDEPPAAPTTEPTYQLPPLNPPKT
ncbi:hypothetical protein [Amycolatopsis sp. NBC_01286]|uniref:hypothetical protein n=1 Tax=Amycolatopsis sp. NBC_01286 TaxID=2903560 RepID=UPI002E105029|nr:hypothetical protein OG570_46395 [Amycolatopsis sp. NBC_01286]